MKRIIEFIKFVIRHCRRPIIIELPADDGNTIVDYEGVREQFEKYTNGLQRYIATCGMTVHYPGMARVMRYPFKPRYSKMYRRWRKVRFFAYGLIHGRS